VREVIVDPSKVFYDSNTTPHHHFYHVDTGMLEDVDAQQLALEQMPALPSGTELDGVDIILRVRASS
jgi:Fur family iron response transcriptional regulator